MAKHTPTQRRLKLFVDLIIGRLGVGVLHLARRGNRVQMANMLAATMRRIGPLLPRHRLARANLVAAFPQNSPAEIERILNDVWDNMGRVAAEFAHLDRIKLGDYRNPHVADVIYDARSLEILAQIQRDKRPNIFFSAHLANWEISALVPPFVGLSCSTLYRNSNIKAIDDAVVRMRNSCMGTLVPSGFEAPVLLANALSDGAQIGMLVDQRFRRGVEVTFFGRPCWANPLLAELAQRFEHPIRGVRVMRLKNRNTFRGEVTEPIELPRDSDGRIDVKQTSQAMASIVENWIREDPGQWLWLHDRWR